MGTAIFPSLTGLGWSITRTSQWQTRKPVAISGKETAIADWANARYTWELVHNVLRQGSGIYTPNDSWTEMETLFGFYNARAGGMDTFLYEDQDDNTAYNQELGVWTADVGTNRAFQLVRSFGGFVEPILAPSDAISGTTKKLTSDSGLQLTSDSGAPLISDAYTAFAVFLNGVALNSSHWQMVGWGAGSGIVTGTGSINSGTNVVALASQTSTIAPGMYITMPGVPFPTYITAVGPGSLTLSQNASSNESNVSYCVAGSGTLLFDAAYSVGDVVTANFGYYWPCRFSEDKCAFEKFMAYRYRVKKLTFMSIL